MTAPAEFYERLWRTEADGENAARWSFQQGLVARALDRLGGPDDPGSAVRLAGRVVLEIGPGVGTETRALIGRGASVVAVDVTAAALTRTRAVTGDAALCVRAAAESLPLAPGSIDAVFAQTVLMHLDVPRAAAEWARVLRPGGRVVIVEPLAGNPLVALYRRFFSPYRETRPRYVTLASLAAAAGPAGLAVTHHEEHYLLAVAALALPQALRPAAIAVFAAIDGVLLRLPGAGRLAWMTLVELRRAG